MLNYRRATAVGKNKIEIGNQGSERIRIVFDTRQRGGRIYIPKNSQGIRFDPTCDTMFELGIIRSYAAVLNDQVGSCRPREHLGKIARRGINDAFDITVVARVAL